MGGTVGGVKDDFDQRLDGLIGKKKWDPRLRGDDASFFS